MENKMKLFKCNPEITKVAEWCFARNKKEAFEVMDKFWDDGAIMEETYLSCFLEINPDKTVEDFIEIFFISEELDKDFTHPYGGENNAPVTKKVSEWIDEVGLVPSYLCHEKWEE